MLRSLLSFTDMMTLRISNFRAFGTTPADVTGGLYLPARDPNAGDATRNIQHDGRTFRIVCVYTSEAVCTERISLIIAIS